MRLATAVAALLACPFAAIADCDHLLFEFDVRSHQRKWAFTAIDKAGEDAATICRYAARLAGIYAIRSELAPRVAACDGAPKSMEAGFEDERSALEKLNKVCPAYDEARCADIATKQLEFLDANLTKENQNLVIEDLKDDFRCKFAISLKHVVMNATADFTAIDNHCPKTFGDDVEAAMLPVRIANARRTIEAQEKKVRPWLAKCE